MEETQETLNLKKKNKKLRTLRENAIIIKITNIPQKALLELNNTISTFKKIKRREKNNGNS